MIVEANLILIAILPLIGSLVAYAVGKRVPMAAGWIATGACLGSFLLVLKNFWLLPSSIEEQRLILEQTVFTWFAADLLNVKFNLRMDQLSAVMSLIVTGIGTLIHLYSIGYMAEDPSRARFFAYLNLFMFSMLLLVLGGNLLVLFVGWEGVGLCSYLLIGFWFKNIDFAAAGKKAFIVNRIGDAGFLLGIFLLFGLFETVDFQELRYAITQGASGVTDYLWIVAICLFVGATGKSAQIPLFVWLPDAMAGPTPVSALIHAATMVTAGIYMLARMHFLFDLTPGVMLGVTIVATITAFVAATTAMAQNDIKKVLAYSTVSQLGFMFMAAGVGAYAVAIFHVMTHAFFKACLFLGAGSVIHGCHHEQDMRKMGGLRSKMPITFFTYFVSVLAISGIYPFAGYQSKHAILSSLQNFVSDAAISFNPLQLMDEGIAFPIGEILALIATLIACLTAFYMTRSLVLTFFGEYRGKAHPHESPILMWIPLVVLAFLALVGGVLVEGHLFDYLALAGLYTPAIAHESIGASLIHSWPGLLGFGLAILFYTKFNYIPKKIFNAVPSFSKLLENKWYFDEIYLFLIIRPLRSASNFLFKGVDRGVIDSAVNGTASLVDVSGELARTTQTGQVRHYALFMFLATVFIIVFCLVR